MAALEMLCCDFVGNLDIPLESLKNVPENLREMIEYEWNVPVEALKMCRNDYWCGAMLLKKFRSNPSAMRQLLLSSAIQCMDNILRLLMEWWKEPTFLALRYPNSSVIDFSGHKGLSFPSLKEDEPFIAEINSNRIAKIPRKCTLEQVIETFSWLNSEKGQDDKFYGWVNSCEDEAFSLIEYVIYNGYSLEHGKHGFSIRQSRI